MTVTSDDISNLRAHNVSDDKILDSLKKFAPQDAGDIQKLQDNGMKAGDIVDSYVKYRQQQPSQSPPDASSDTIVDKAVRMGQGFSYGLGNEARRIGSTAQVLTGHGKETGDWIGDQTDKFTNMSGQYNPASNHLALDPRTWDYAPRAVVEGVGALSGYLTAGAAAAAAAPEVAGAGLAGAGAYGMLHYLGKDAEARAANNGHATPTSGDVWGAVPGSAAQALLDAAGSRFIGGNALLAEAPVTGAGLQAMKQTGLNVAKAAGVNGLTAGASDAAGQLGTSIGTDKGVQFDPSEVAHAAQVGAVISGLQKAGFSAPEALGNKKFSGFDPEVASKLADDLNSDRIGGNPSDPADNAKLIGNGKNIIGGDVKDYLSDLQSQANDLNKKQAAATKDALTETYQDEKGQTKSIPPKPEEVQAALEGQPKASADLDSVIEHANNLVTNLKGGTLDPAMVEKAKAGLGDHQPLLDGILKLNMLNHLSDMADVKGEGAAHSPNIFDTLWAIKKYKTAVAAASLGAGALAGMPMAGAGLASLPFLMAGAAKLKAGLMRTPETMGDFVSRFKGQGPEPTPNPAAPAAPQAAPQVNPWAEAGGVGPKTAASAQAALALQKQRAMQGLAAQEAAGRENAPNEFGFTPQDLSSAQASYAAQKQRAMSQLAAQEFAQRQQPAQLPGVSESPIGLNQKQQESAAGDLEKQRMRAMGKLAAQEHKAREDAAKAPGKVVGQVKPAEQAPVAVQKALASAMKSDKASTKKAPEEAPETAESDSIRLENPEMSRLYSKGQIRKSPGAVNSGIEQRSGSRHEIIDSAKNLPFTSQHAKKVYEGHVANLKLNTDHNANTEAKGLSHLAKVLNAKGLGEVNSAMLAHHFATARSAKYGHSFTSSYGHKSQTEVEAAQKINAAVAKGKATKAHKKKK